MTTPKKLNLIVNISDHPPQNFDNHQESCSQHPNETSEETSPSNLKGAWKRLQRPIIPLAIGWFDIFLNGLFVLIHLFGFSRQNPLKTFLFVYDVFFIMWLHNGLHLLKFDLLVKSPLINLRLAREWQEANKLLTKFFIVITALYVCFSWEELSENSFKPLALLFGVFALVFVIRVANAVIIHSYFLPVELYIVSVLESL